MSVCLGKGVCVHECWCPEWPEALIPLELELWAIVKLLTWVLGGELRSSRRAVCAPNSATSPASRGSYLKARNAWNKLCPLAPHPKLGNSKEKNEVEAFSQGRSDMKTPQDRQRLMGS